MALIELLFVVLLACILAGGAAVAVLVHGVARRSEAQSTELAELRAELSVGGQSHEQNVSELRTQLAQTHTAVETFRSALVARQQVEDEARQSLRRLEAIIAGSSTRGAAGENILEEGIKHLPPDMVHRNAWINGKVVEFALRLPGGKLLPIDSKWTSSQALEALSDPEVDPSRRTQLAREVEKEVEKRIREVSQYIEPTCTSPWAVAAVPDAAYALCRSAFAEAHRRHVIVVGYSLALPYLLALYQLHLQFARSVDMENLQACLMDIDRQVEALDSIFENRIQRSLTVLQNAFSEGKQSAARIRAATRSIQVAERLADPAATLFETPESELPVEPIPVRA
jgi:DNA recombination protein RmuC